MENIDALWDQVLSQMEKKVSKPSYETWLKSTKAASLKGDTLTVTAPNEFARDWLEGRKMVSVRPLPWACDIPLLLGEW